MMETMTRGRASGSARDIRPDEYRIELSCGCLDEVRRAADDIRGLSVADDPARPGRFCDAGLPPGDGASARNARSWPALRDCRSPADGRIEPDEATAIYWLLSSMVSRPVAQKLDGTMIYDVLDTGRRRSRDRAFAPTRPISRSAFTTTTPTTRRRPTMSACCACVRRRAAGTAASSASRPCTIALQERCRTPLQRPTGRSGSTASANIGRAKARSFRLRFSRHAGELQGAVQRSPDHRRICVEGRADRRRRRGGDRRDARHL